MTGSVKIGSNYCISTIPNNTIEKIDIVQLDGYTMKQWYDKQSIKPDYLINASLWDNKGAIGTIYEDGKLVRDEGNGYGFGITIGGGFGFSDPWSVSWNDYITGYPALIRNGSILPDAVDSYVMNSSNNRSIVASAGNNLYLITTSGMTIAQLRKFLSDNGFYNAINLDGGGSSRLMVNGNVVNNPTADRKCPNAIAVYLKKENINNEEDNIMSNTFKVFLGVGHGGSDPGAVANNMEEADINLTMALACYDELIRHNIDVKLSRMSDEDDPLPEEIEECNAFNPDLAVDIHTNAGGGDGFEVYHTIYGGTGKTLAENINAEIISAGQNSRGIKTRKSDVTGKDYYGFIRQTLCPAVIVEIGFIDNKTDLQDFDEQAEQIKFGKAYAHGILKTLGVEIMTDTPQTPVQDETKHWAYPYYKSLVDKGIEINEMDFDRPITRGETFAMLDRVINALIK